MSDGLTPLQIFRSLRLLPPPPRHRATSRAAPFVWRPGPGGLAPRGRRRGARTAGPGGRGEPGLAWLEAGPEPSVKPRLSPCALHPRRPGRSRRRPQTLMVLEWGVRGLEAGCLDQKRYLHTAKTLLWNLDVLPGFFIVSLLCPSHLRKMRVYL